MFFNSLRHGWWFCIIEALNHLILPEWIRELRIKPFQLPNSTGNGFFMKNIYLVTFKMVSRLALSTAIRSLLSAKNKKKRTNCWFFSLCRQNGSKFSLREVTKGTKYRAFCLNTDVWYGHTGYYWIKCPILCGRSLIKEAGNQRQE